MEVSRLNPIKPLILVTFTDQEAKDLKTLLGPLTREQVRDILLEETRIEANIRRINELVYTLYSGLDDILERGK